MAKGRCGQETGAPTGALEPDSGVGGAPPIAEAGGASSARGAPGSRCVVAEDACERAVARVPFALCAAAVPTSGEVLDLGLLRDALRDLLLVPLLPYPPLPLLPAGTRGTQVLALYSRLVGRKRLRIRAVSKRGGGRCGRGSLVRGTSSQGSPSGRWLRKKDRAMHHRTFMYYSLPRYETQR